MTYRMLALTSVLLACPPSHAQAQAHGTHSPHAGLETRQIKALSDDDVTGFLAGRGMGLAIPAELNRYPGPRHVLDLASELQLSPEQDTAIRGIFEAMQERASALGHEYVALERELDRQFASRTVDEDRLLRLTTDIGRVLAEKRFMHLRAHLQTTALLTPEQVRQYDVHRGY